MCLRHGRHLACRARTTLWRTARQRLAFTLLSWRMRIGVICITYWPACRRTAFLAITCLQHRPYVMYAPARGKRHLPLFVPAGRFKTVACREPRACRRSSAAHFLFLRAPNSNPAALPRPSAAIILP